MKMMLSLICFFLWGCNLLTTPKDTLPPATETKMKLLWEIPYNFVGSSIVASPLILGDSLVIMGGSQN